MRQNPELFDSLERAGFRVDREVGFLDLAVTRAGGYYLDVGGSAKIISGEIKVKSDSPIERFTNSGLLFKNGSQLEADVIVFATGFTRNYAKQIESIVGESVASRIGSFWSLDEEGEQLNVMKPAGMSSVCHGYDYELTMTDGGFSARSVALRWRSFPCEMVFTVCSTPNTSGHSGQAFSEKQID